VRLRIGLLIALVAVVIASATATASPITIPPGLAPGSTYFLAFVTGDERDATSSNILDYNAFVTKAAYDEPALLASAWDDMEGHWIHRISQCGLKHRHRCDYTGL